VTYIFVLELVAINIFLAWNIFAIPGFIQNMDDVVKLANTVFSDDEMAMLGGIIGFWFGSRGWNRK